MEFNYVDGYMNFVDNKPFKFMSFMWATNKSENGYFTIGVPFNSANSEVLYNAFPLSLLLNNRNEIFNKLIENELIESSLINFYELGGNITYNTKNTKLDKSTMELINDEQIDKILYCWFMISKFYDERIFYIKHIAEVMNFMPSHEVDIEIAKVFEIILNRYMITPYIIKLIPVPKESIREVRDYQEVVIWDIYQNYRKTMVINKVTFDLDVHFDEEYFGSYAIFNANEDTFVKPNIQEKATGYALALVLRKMGNSAFIYRPKINTNTKFRTLIFMVATRLLTLNQIFYLHGDLHSGNFVLEISNKLWFSNYIKCEDLFIYNNIDLYINFDLIDFGDCVNFHDSVGLVNFIKKVVPNIYSNYEETINLIAKTSPQDLAIAASLLDIHYFIESFFNASTEYKQISDTREQFQLYIVEEFTKYLDVNKVQSQQFEGGSHLSRTRYRGGMSCNFTSALSMGNYMIEGGADEMRMPNFNLTTRLLPIFKMLNHFYREESNLIDKEKILNAII